MGRVQYVVIVALAMAVAVLGTVLVMQRSDVASPLSSNVAWAQESGSSQASYILGMVGPLTQNVYVPIVLVNTRKQTIMMYEYDVARKQFSLKQARNYQYDSECVEFPAGAQAVPPTVGQIHEFVTKLRGGAP
jgi:hypothetical protein